MKKIVMFLISGILVLSLTACGATQANDKISQSTGAGNSSSSSISGDETAKTRPHTSSSDSKIEETESSESSEQDVNSSSTETIAPVIQPEGSVNSLPAGWSTDVSYITNKYYDIVAVYEYSDDYYDYAVHKVLAKQDGSVYVTATYYDKSGSEIDYDLAAAVLTAGEYNYLYYYLSHEDNIDSVNIDYELYSAENEHQIGDRKGIIVEDYVVENKELKVSLKKEKPNVGTFPRLKIAFFKDDTLMRFDSLSISAVLQKMPDIGSIGEYTKWIGNLDYDSIEVIYEP